MLSGPEVYDAPQARHLWLRMITVQARSLGTLRLDALRATDHHPRGEVPRRFDLHGTLPRHSEGGRVSCT